MTTYRICYEGDVCAEIEIDHPKADPLIKEMVQFWMGWEKKYKANGNDYTKTWLMMLVKRVLHNTPPDPTDEGWIPLDGSQGIELTFTCPWYPNEDLIEIDTL